MTRLANKLTSEFATARAVIAAYRGRMASRPLLVEVRTLLDQIEASYPLMSARQREVPHLQRSGQQERANELLNFLNDIQLTVQNQRELLQNKMTEFEQQFLAGPSRSAKDTCFG